MTQRNSLDRDRLEQLLGGNIYRDEILAIYDGKNPVQPGRDEDPSILLVEMAMLAMLLRKYKYLVSVDTKDPTDLRDVKYIRDFTSEINPSIVVVI
jgi:hypothetical protein